MSSLIPVELIPRGVNDARSRAFASALDRLLSRFSTSALLVQDPLTVDARLLPSMVISLAMTDFLPAGLNEAALRRILAVAPDIHKWTGTVKGARMALGALGITVVWKQWYQQQPKGAHDTHIVTAYVNELLFEGEENLLSARTQKAVIKQLEATRRWSQHIDFQIGVNVKGWASVAAVSQTQQVRRHTGAHSHLRVRDGAAGALAVGGAIQARRHNAAQTHTRIRGALPAAAAASQAITTHRGTGGIGDSRTGLSLPALLASGQMAAIHKGSWRPR